ncbi:uncharacterized protein LOC128740088 [Sabethes cyaneus]|uniref:uncharacterized protein LOC128740088 n=1 Tax=Sabethes cyaneus TaxID=53552 RepID=UPI00237D6897|nr:uncharacterized protein LOC128740088 [Sabethes cyaneus]
MLRCKFCGVCHDFSKGSCPALAKRCYHCKGKNHFEKVCSKRRSKNANKKWRVKEVTEDTSASDSEEEPVNGATDESDDDYEIGKIVDNSENSGSVAAKLKLLFADGWKSVECELDTGANTSLIGREYLIKLNKQVNLPLFPSKLRLQSFGSNPIKVLGQIKIPCRRKGRRYVLVLQVVEGNHHPLLSAKVCRILGFVRFSVSFVTNKSVGSLQLLNVHRVEAQKIIDSHTEIFKGYGKLAGTVSLEVDPDVTPSMQSLVEYLLLCVPN